MMAAADRQIAKYERRFTGAAEAMASSVSEAALRAAVHAIHIDTGAGEMAVRAAVREASVTRQVIDRTGRIFASVLRTALPDPWAPEAFDAAAFQVAQLLITAWRAGASR